VAEYVFSSIKIGGIGIRDNRLWHSRTEFIPTSIAVQFASISPFEPPCARDITPETLAGQDQL